MEEVRASWYSEIPERDFISKAPTYPCGELLSLFHKDQYTYAGQTLSYFWYDPREHGYEDPGDIPLLTFVHGTGNSFVGDMCINYSGAERYASEEYQKTMGGAFILIPIANEYKGEDGQVYGRWEKEYLEIIHALILAFIADKTGGVGLKVLFGNSSGATFVMRLMDNYMDDFDIVIPVGSGDLPEDSVLDQYEAKGKFMFLAIGKRDEFNPFSKWIEPRLSRLERMKNIFMYTPEWVRNGDKGIASIVAGVEMGQHCLMNPVQENLMFDDGMPMEPKLPRGVTGWLADRREERRTKGAL